jgi:hypothetical protein
MAAPALRPKSDLRNITIIPYYCITMYNHILKMPDIKPHPYLGSVRNIKAVLNFQLPQPKKEKNRIKVCFFS